MFSDFWAVERVTLCTSTGMDLRSLTSSIPVVFGRDFDSQVVKLVSDASQQPDGQLASSLAFGTTDYWFESWRGMGVC
ncbi:hypothetical protein CEXT_810841 [Caerostris extrusa]|uniref:Uncharacterized protein n=1 Tax=Caerostris extrusa TaxID=172846 RepID=A0AAV4XLI5_CAEEX|nr:hypothetical protein CEXT_810841 [Caerostris extrusa]